MLVAQTRTSTRPAFSRTSKIRKRLVGRRGERLAGAQAEARAVARADDLGIFDGSIVKRGVVVGAAVFERVQRAINTRHAHSVAVDVGFET